MASDVAGLRAIFSMRGPLSLKTWAQHESVSGWSFAASAASNTPSGRARSDALARWTTAVSGSRVSAYSTDSSWGGGRGRAPLAAIMRAATGLLGSA